MACKVDSFVRAKLFNEPGNTRFFSIYACECGEDVDTPTNGVQLRTHQNEFGLASSFDLTDGDEIFLFSFRIRWIVLSGMNEGIKGWGKGRDGGDSVSIAHDLHPQ